MSCAKGTVSWFCLYPDKCTSTFCDGRDTCDHSCCDNGNCANSCNLSKVTHGGCCNDAASKSGWWFAWPAQCTPPFGVSCGALISFTPNCQSYWGAKRADTGPACSLDRLADFTQALFTQMKPLCSGIITGVRATTSAGCC